MESLGVFYIIAVYYTALPESGYAVYVVPEQTFGLRLALGVEGYIRIPYLYIAIHSGIDIKRDLRPLIGVPCVEYVIKSAPACKGVGIDDSYAGRYHDGVNKTARVAYGIFPMLDIKHILRIPGTDVEVGEDLIHHSVGRTHKGVGENQDGGIVADILDQEIDLSVIIEYQPIIGEVYVAIIHLAVMYFTGVICDTAVIPGAELQDDGGKVVYYEQSVAAQECVYIYALQR